MDHWSTCMCSVPLIEDAINRKSSSILEMVGKSAPLAPLFFVMGLVTRQGNSKLNFQDVLKSTTPS